MGAASKILHAGIRDIAALNTLQLLAIDIGNRFQISSLTSFEIPRRKFFLRYAPGIPFSQSRTTPSREWRPDFSSLSHALVLARLESSAVAAAPAQLVSATAYHIILLKNLIYAFYAQCEI
jgi:hypothetical protein